MTGRIFRIPFAAIDVVCEIKEFLILMGRDGQMPLQEDFCMKNLIYIILHMRNMLKDEIRADVCQDEGNSKYQYYEITHLKIIKPIGDMRKVQFFGFNR